MDGNMDNGTSNLINLIHILTNASCAHHNFAIKLKENINFILTLH